MDSIDLTKFAAAALCALLLIVAPKAAIEMAGGHGGAEPVGYTLPAGSAPATNETGGGTPAAGGFSFARVADLIPKASAENGAAIFKKCAACHTAEKGAANKVGPNLWGVAGRKMASAAGFTYSDTLKSKGGEWTFENLASFVHSPKAFVPGTKMVFPGVTDPAQLADLLAYVRTLADAPAPLPAAP